MLCDVIAEWMIQMFRTYSEMMTFKTFEERFNYLKLNGVVGQDKFGFDRYMNQRLYHNSKEWKAIRRRIIVRDNGCDLGIDGHEILDRIIVHHINPISIDDLLEHNPIIFDPDNLICVSHNTHNAIHYGDKNLLTIKPIERTKNDTCPWRNK